MPTTVHRALTGPLVYGANLGTQRHWRAPEAPGTVEDDPQTDLGTPVFAGASAMEPTGIEPVTSCLQSSMEEDTEEPEWPETPGDSAGRLGSTN